MLQQQEVVTEPRHPSISQSQKKKRKHAFWFWSILQHSSNRFWTLLVDTTKLYTLTKLVPSAPCAYKLVVRAIKATANPVCKLAGPNGGQSVMPIWGTSDGADVVCFLVQAIRPRWNAMSKKDGCNEPVVVTVLSATVLYERWQGRTGIFVKCFFPPFPFNMFS